MSEVTVTDPHTGGMKGQKPERYDLIPWGWATDEISRVYAFGANKYADDNWRKGYSWRLSIGALFRHCVLFACGQDLDAESGLHHLAHAAFHLNTLLVFWHEGLGTDDRAKPKAKPGGGTPPAAPMEDAEPPISIGEKIKRAIEEGRRNGTIPPKPTTPAWPPPWIQPGEQWPFEYERSPMKFWGPLPATCNTAPDPTVVYATIN